jgi:hypothetical protein
MADEQRCAECRALTGTEVYCQACADHSDCVLAGDARDDDDTDAASLVFNWAERWRVLKGMPKETWELFQECVEDLRA